MLHWMYKTPLFFPSEYLGSISSQFVATCFGSDENTRANRMNCNDVDWTSETSLLWPNTSNALERRTRHYLSSSYQRTRPVKTLFFFALSLVFNRIVFQWSICHGAILLISQPCLCKNIGFVASAAWSSPVSCENHTLEDYQSSDQEGKKKHCADVRISPTPFSSDSQRKTTFLYFSFSTADPLFYSHKLLLLVRVRHYTY